MVSKRRGRIVGTLGAVAILLIVALIAFDWNWLKGPIESQVSGRLGRPLRIHGDLDVELSLQPRITIEGAELGNAPWASDAPMAKIDRVEVTVDLLKLMQGEIVLPEIRIARPNLLLETRPDGPPNWQFGEAQETSPGPPALPRIARLEVSDASIRYHDVGSGRNLTAGLTRIAGRTDPDLTLNANGKVQGEPLDFEITGAALTQLENGAKPYPASLTLKLGQSDLHGDLSLDLFQEVPAIRAKLASDRVVTTDFTALFDSPQRSDATLEKPSGEPELALEEVWSKAGRESSGGTTFDPSQLPALDAELQYSIAELQGPDLALRDLHLNAALDDRLPRLELTGGGQYKGKPVVLNLQAGTEGGPDATYVIDARIEAGQTRIAAAGGIRKPEQLQDVEVQFEADEPRYHRASTSARHRGAGAAADTGRRQGHPQQPSVAAQ